MTGLGMGFSKNSVTSDRSGHGFL